MATKLNTASDSAIQPVTVESQMDDVFCTRSVVTLISEPVASTKLVETQILELNSIGNVDTQTMGLKDTNYLIHNNAISLGRPASLRAGELPR